MKTLDVELRDTPTRWWTTHKRHITTWETFNRLLAIIFVEDAGGMNYRYDGQTDTRIHMEVCVQAWQHRNVDERVHLFVHTLDTIPKYWYIETELHRCTENWPLLIEGFQLTFGFESKYPKINDALEVIRVKAFDDCPLPLFNQPDWET